MKKIQSWNRQAEAECDDYNAPSDCTKLPCKGKVCCFECEQLSICMEDLRTKPCFGLRTTFITGDKLTKFIAFGFLRRARK